MNTESLLTRDDINAILTEFEKSNTLDAFDDEYMSNEYVASSADITILEWQAQVREYCNTHSRLYNPFVVIDALNAALLIRDKPYLVTIRTENEEYLLTVVQRITPLRME